MSATVVLLIWLTPKNWLTPGYTFVNSFQLPVLVPAPDFALLQHKQGPFVSSQAWDRGRRRDGPIFRWIAPTDQADPSRLGDVIAEKFVLRSIGIESVRIGFVGFPPDEMQTIGLGQ